MKTIIGLAIFPGSIIFFGVVAVLELIAPGNLLTQALREMFGQLNDIVIGFINDFLY